MNKITFFAYCIVIFLSACSEPKYIQTEIADQNTSNAQESKMVCNSKFQKSEICFTWHWEKIPTATDTGTLIFKTYRMNLFDQTAIEIDPSNLPQLILWMPSMGHGSSPTQTVRLDIGTYRMTNVFFIMPGEWELKFQIKNEDQIIDETIVQITI